MEQAAPEAPQALLCVTNFPADTGFAWDFIESLYAGVADRLMSRGVRTWVAYPELVGEVGTLAGSAAEAVELPVTFGDARRLWALMKFSRSRGVRVMYLSDRPVWHPAYLLLRLAGVRRIVVHDHTSGDRTRPRGVKWALKWLLRRIPGMLADDVVAVSDFVARRKVEVDLVPRARVHRVWNSLVLPPEVSGASARLRERFGLEAQRPIIACTCRAAPEKGVQHLVLAFDRLTATAEGRRLRPLLLYMGDGPYLGELERLRAQLECRDAIVFPGYVAGAADLVAGADVCAVPSVWGEAFGLAALEPMARGVAVVASRAGGIPEVVVDGETGLLVAPGDEDALAAALLRLLSAPEERSRMGAAGRARAAALFSRDSALEALVPLLAQGFRGPGNMMVAGRQESSREPARSGEAR